MTELLYEDGLKQALSSLGQIEKELTRLNIQKDELRDKIRKWMEINELKEHDSVDSNGDKLWRVTISVARRKSVNYDVLREKVTPDDFDEIVSHGEYTTFKCQQVKSKKKSGGSAPSAPKANA